jgi:hypothetical protein
MIELIRPRDQQVAITLDIGEVPRPHEYAGQFVITIQAAPIPNIQQARTLAKAMKEALGSRLSIRLDASEDVL